MNYIISLFSDCFKNSSPPEPPEKSVSKVTLHDGSQVAEAAYNATLLLLDYLQTKPFKAILQFDLYQKAQDPSYSFPAFPMGPSSPAELQKLGFLDNKKEMHEDVAAIVRNAFKKGNFGVVKTHPLTGEELGKDYSWEQLELAFGKKKQQ